MNWIYFINDGPLSAADRAINNTFRLYQKAGSGNLSIELTEPTTNVSIKIYDHMGKLTYTNENMDTNGIEVTGLNNGVHIININGDNLIYKTTFIVQ